MEDSQVDTSLITRSGNRADCVDGETAKTTREHESLMNLCRANITCGLLLDD
jgi:hypothetical protein